MLEGFKYKRVALIGVDGAGSFFRRADIPCLDRIFENGATSYDVETVFPSVSAECWGSFLIGTTAHVHGLTNNVIFFREYDMNSPFPTVFRRIREAMPDAKLASFAHWGPLNYGVIEHNIDVHFATDSDYGLANYIAEYVEKNDPTFIFVQFDETDSVGHQNGYGSERHLEQISTTDGYIDQIYKAYEKLGPIEETLFIVTADHGGTNMMIDGKLVGDHGGITDEELYVFFGAAGKTVKKGTLGEMKIQDTAAIILHALGLDVPEFDIHGFSGQIPENLFEGYTPTPRHKFERIVLEHETVPTPDAESGKCIADILDPSKLEAVLHFDGDTDDATGKVKLFADGAPKYLSDGYHGSCVEVGWQGCIVIPDFRTGRDSFSLSFWFYFDSSLVDGDVPFFGTKYWSVGITEGFMMYYRERTEEHYSEVRRPLPWEISHGWINMILTVDRETGDASFYFNFGKKQPCKLAELFSGFGRENSSMRIGSDGVGRCNHYNFRIDDFVFYRGVLTEENVADLAKYYGK